MSASGMLNSDRLSSLERRAQEALAEHLPAAIELRHVIHREPDTGGEEVRTRRRIMHLLGRPGTELAEGMYVRVGLDDGPAIAIRAELDALPVQEHSGYPWASNRAGVAHLCGHDVHAAALAAVTLALAGLDLPLPFIAAFQPREEMMPSGARDFIVHTGFLDQNIRAMIGIHLQPALPLGAVSAVGGPVNASADDFAIRIDGTPAHGAYPHLSNDPIVAAAAVVQAVQHLVSRRTDPMDPTVVTVGRIWGGASNNQIPGHVELGGTVRSFSETHRTALHAQLRDLATAVTTGYGCASDVTFELGEPVLTNDHDLAHWVSTALERQGFTRADPFRSCGADDFAFYATLFPTLMVFAGIGDGAKASPGLHHPSFVPDDDAVQMVSNMMLTSYFAAARGLTAHHPEVDQ